MNRDYVVNDVVECCEKLQEFRCNEIGLDINFALGKRGSTRSEDKILLLNLSTKIPCDTISIYELVTMHETTSTCCNASVPTITDDRCLDLHFDCILTVNDR